jgi:hypothetical protein
MSKILKNLTASPVALVDVGVTVPASGTYTISEKNYCDWAASADTLTAIAAAQLILNDGLRDLSMADSLRFILYPDVALNIRFLNSPDRANSFTARNVQEAIEEAKSNAGSDRSRFTINTGFDGTASVGRYLEFQSNVSCDVSGFVLPRAAHLWEMSFAIGSNSACTFTVYTWNGSVETSIATINTTASQRKVSITGLDVGLAANAELRVKCTAGSGARPVLSLWFLFD